MANKKRRKVNRSRAQAHASRPAARTAVDERPTSSPRDTELDAGREAPKRPREASAASQRSRAEKKELARRQREEVRRRMRRAAWMRRAALGGTLAAVAAVGVFMLTRPNEPVASDRLPGLLRNDAPWPANAADANARAQAINLPRHGSTLAMHEHANVQVYVHGTRQPVPVDIGITDRNVESIHTHTADGVVHIESSTVADFTLQQFFDVWGVRFSQDCLGGYCNQGNDRLQVWVDGQETTQPFDAVPLDDQTVYVVTYGTPNELPDPIPSTFDFASVAP